MDILLYMMYYLLYSLMLILYLYTGTTRNLSAFKRFWQLEPELSPGCNPGDHGQLIRWSDAKKHMSHMNDI